MRLAPAGKKPAQIVAHHGTDAKFTDFSLKYAREGSFGKGIYFSSTKAYARRHGRRVVTATLALSNPAGMKEGLAAKFDTRLLARRGFDGVAVRLAHARVTIYVVFRPWQARIQEPA